MATTVETQPSNDVTVPALVTGPRVEHHSGVLGTYVRAQLAAIIRTEPSVRDGDPDAVHDMRVATRRLRSTLRTFRPLLDRERTEPLRDELHWLADRLGEVRDDDVMAQRLTAAVHAEPPELVLGPVAARIQSQLAAHGAQARVALVEALDSDRYQRLLTQSAALAAALPSGVPKKRLRRLVRKAVRRADARLAAADRADPDQRDARLHAARRAYKRARYAAEALRPVAGRPAKRMAKRLSALQDVLGGHQDAIVTGTLLRDYGIHAHLAGENAFTFGLLHSRQHAAGERILGRLAKTRSRAGKPKVRRWLQH